MIDRRDLLKIGATTSLALGIPAALRASAPSLGLWVRDVRFARDAMKLLANIEVPQV